jgi:outer membrane protein assembly factor BamB
MRGDRRRVALRGRLLVAACLPIVLGAVVAASSIRSLAALGPDSGAHALAPAAPAGVDDWPTFHHDSSRVGVSAESALGASNASSLQQAWSEATGAACPCTSFSSPTVAYNPTLGKSLVYVGNQQGDLSAFDADTGSLVWRYSVPTPPPMTWQSKNIEGTPAVSTANNAVYFGASDGYFYVLNATTGVPECTYNTALASPGGHIAASPLIEDGLNIGGASMDVAYFGDNGQSGTASDGGNEWAVNVTPGSFPSGGSCSLVWRIGPFPLPGTSAGTGSGTYTSPAGATLPSGEHVVVFGTTDPDDQVYEVDAATGSVKWHFQTQVGKDTDVGAAATISAPGVNGFADGVVYDTGKDGNVYAIDLVTGSQIWMYSLTNNHPSQSSAALVGDTLYEGYGGGEIALNASTGAVVWNDTSIPANISSPAVSGAPGNQVLLLGDYQGGLWALRLSDGGVLYHTTVSSAQIFASPAVSTGRVFISSADGNLYAYAPTSSRPPFLPQNVGQPVAVLTPDGGQKLVFWRENGGTNDGHLVEAWYGLASQQWSGPLDLTTTLSIPTTGNIAANSAPAVTFTPDGGQQLVFWEGQNNDLWEAWYSYKFSNWQVQDLTAVRGLAGAGDVGSTPTVTFTPGGGQQLVFWQGKSDNDLWEAWYSLKYSAWQSEDLSTGLLHGQGAGTLASAPSVILTPGGGQQLAFWEGSNGHVWEAWYSVAYSLWQVQDLTASHFPSAASIASQPEVILTPDAGQQLVFYRAATSNDLYEAWYTVSSSAWQAQDLSSAHLGGMGSVASEPQVTVTSDGGQQLVFWQTTTGDLDEAWYSVKYSTWASQDLSSAQGLPSGAALQAAPSLIVFSNGDQDVFWQGSGATLWELGYAAGRWTYHDWSAGG